MRVAGTRGRQFDAKITGADPDNPGISLAPFSKNLPVASARKRHGETEGLQIRWKGQRLRIIVLNVRGKTVVVYVESTYADQPRFRDIPNVSTFAQRLLTAVKFPR